MQLSDFKLTDAQLEEGVDLHDVQHLVTLPELNDESRCNTMASVEADMQLVDYKALE